MATYVLSEEKFDVSIIIPTKNECRNIENIIKEIFKEFRDLRIELIIIDGGSSDCTVQRAKEVIGELNIPGQVISLPGMGKPAALLEGFKAARGRYVATIDADLEFSPQDLRNLVHAIDGADMAAGARIDKRPFIRRIISKGATLLAKIVLKKARRFVDPITELYVIRKENIMECIDRLNPRIKPFLEIIEKCNVNNIKNVYIIQRNRIYGNSKFNMHWIFDYLIQLGELSQWFTARYLAIALAAGIAAGFLGKIVGPWALAASVIGRWIPLRRYIALPQLALAEMASTTLKLAIGVMPYAWLAGGVVEVILVHLLRR